jgi:hypothetical protein
MQTSRPALKWPSTVVARSLVAENMDGDTDGVVLAWQRGDAPGKVEFVVTSSQANELLALLAEEGLSAATNRRPVRSPSPDVLTTVVAVIGSPAACAAAGLAVRKFFDRHRGKRIRIDETGLAEAENYSARDIARIVRTLSAVEQDKQDERR